MIIKFALITFLLSIQLALACEVTLPHQMIILSDDLSGKSVYQSKDCDEKVLNELHHVLIGMEGRVASYQLKELMKGRGHGVEINPQSILIQQLSSLIREQLTLPSGVQVKKTYSGSSSILPLPAGDKVHLTCSSCLFGSLQPLTLNVSGFDGTNHTVQVKADFMRMVKAFRLVSAVPSFSSLDNMGLFSEEYIESIPHADLITDREELKYYKTNKPLRAGDILKKSDLNAINLVRAGVKTEVVLENHLIKIKTQGISNGNGTIGDLVEVYNQEKKKKYLGKVIDTNKVLVEL